MANWFIGIRKNNFSIKIRKKTFESGYFVQVLDGDNIRSGISNNLSFSEKDRLENIRRISEVSKLFINCGIITINCFVSPTNTIRNKAKEIIGEENFIGIYINSDLSICEKETQKAYIKKHVQVKLKILPEFLLNLNNLMNLFLR